MPYRVELTDTAIETLAAWTFSKELKLAFLKDLRDRLGTWPAHKLGRPVVAPVSRIVMQWTLVDPVSASRFRFVVWIDDDHPGIRYVTDMVATREEGPKSRVTE